jgi:hypothetical protein
MIFSMMQMMMIIIMNQGGLFACFSCLEDVVVVVVVFCFYFSWFCLCFCVCVFVCFPRSLQAGYGYDASKRSLVCLCLMI